MPQERGICNLNTDGVQRERQGEGAGVHEASPPPWQGTGKRGGLGLRCNPEVALAGPTASRGGNGAVAKRPAWDRQGREPPGRCGLPLRPPAGVEIRQLTGVREPLHERVLSKGDLGGKLAPRTFWPLGLPPWATRWLGPRREARR